MSLFDVLYSTSTEFDVSLRQLAVLVFPPKSPMCRICIPQKSPIQNGGCHIYKNAYIHRYVKARKQCCARSSAQMAAHWRYFVICICVCVCVCVHIFMYTYICIYTRSCTWVRIQQGAVTVLRALLDTDGKTLALYMCMCVFACVCVWVYMYIYVCIHTHTHTQTAADSARRGNSAVRATWLRWQDIVSI